MSFNDIELKYSYRSNTDNLVEDFLLKVLNESQEYLRATGYFSVELFNVLEKRIYPFIKNNGLIRIICGIDLNENDIKLINEGYNLRELIEKKIIQEEEYELSLLPNICWLIANKKLEIKIALTNNYGIYHEKFSIFRDLEKNYIATTGSLNETSSGYQKNIEYIDVFKFGRDDDRIAEKLKFFEELWENKTTGIKVFEFNEQLIKKYEKIASNGPICYKDESNIKISDLKNKIILREYQKEAIESLKNNNWQGIFAMATGTGKTITALYALKEFLKIEKNGLVIIVCPYIHLVTQWEKEVIKLFGEEVVLKCFQSKTQWSKELTALVREVILKNILGICITTISTGSSENFLNKINKENIKKILLIDEVHNIGAEESRNILAIDAYFRLGLSATPLRKNDEEGNEFILNYFNKIVYEFSLEKAIKEGYLAEYEYYLYFCELNDEEQMQYDELSKDIAKILQSDQLEKRKEYLKMLLLKRVKILSVCKEKLNKLDKLLKEKKLDKSIFYTAEDKEFFNLTREVLKENNVITLNITSKESIDERNNIINRLDQGIIDGILAMRCLDEGVDIPSVKNAVILSSSSNYKQYIQRRGRILRKLNREDKKIAYIYDFMVVPQKFINNSDKLIIKREFSRIKEFMSSSNNRSEISLELYKFSLKNNCLKELLKEE